jgi:hypothetical protein
MRLAGLAHALRLVDESLHTLHARRVESQATAIFAMESTATMLWSSLRKVNNRLKITTGQDDAQTAN